MDLPDQRRRAVEPYLKFVRLIEDDVPLDTRVAHILDEFTESEFEELADHLGAADVQAGVSVPTVHLQRAWVRDAISDLAADGHSIVLHGQLHTSYMETSYETAHDELSAAIDTIQAEIGERPVGFHVPYSRVSSETVRAAADLGVEWIVGDLSDDETAVSQGSPAIVTPLRPYDLHRLERGTDPERVFDAIADEASDSSLLLFHPNILASYDSLSTFGSWIADRVLRSPDDLVSKTGDGPGLLLDVFPPFTVAKSLS
ncbi:Peptidoglycan/xylan/chitin deacetylase, PgdA/CDA1 family [Halanaeroarchaeum sp. HSR-CO]|uniref:polysaccharide deacetylase family protein n=1 Tax=Halanaeroarchaeum sp. HSR-CO TaxID=2866382 RepID=UPI00217D8EFC|nr:polysaccharide deacetylase family protein [Halanaeroarchaeum sp. HSR-CO]UWG46362.1 Peptidoglycan/xylan/chitin deacetylase, PgdA/CDA1 family [Halanaeroarchaeum sp. HSR-CO]